MTQSNQSNSRISSVNRAIDILLVLSRESGKSVRELGAELNMPKSTLHRTIQTLEYRGFVKQDIDTGKYSLGYTILEISAAIKSQSEIRNVALRPMEELRDLIGDTVQLAILEGRKILIIETVEGTNILRIFSKVGETLPINYGNFGRIFLSHMDSREVKNIMDKYPLKRYGSESIVDKGVYLEKLKEVRESGISISIDDPIDGSVSMAVPIFDKTKNVIASLSVVGAKTPQLIDKIELIKKEIKNTGEKISAEIASVRD